MATGLLNRSLPERPNRYRSDLARLMLRCILALLLRCRHARRRGRSPESQMKSVIDAFAIVEQNAADPVSSEQAFYQGAIPGLLRKLDPHSVFFDPGQFEQLKKMESSTQKGFGSVVSMLPGRVIVLQTLPGTPSAKAGLAPGDEILAINGYIIGRLDIDQIHATAGPVAAAAGAARCAAAGQLAHPALHADARGHAIAQRGARVLRAARASATSACPASMRRPAQEIKDGHREAGRRPPGRAWCSTCATIPAAW